MTVLDDIRDLYQEVILDHGRHPRNHRRPVRFDASAKGDNPMCGDRCEVFVTRGADDVLEDVAFQARGCAISVASGSLMTEVVRGRSVEDARTLFAAFREMARTGTCPACEEDEALERLAPLSGVHAYPSRIKCATLPWHALEAALSGRTEATSER